MIVDIKVKSVLYKLDTEEFSLTNTSYPNNPTLEFPLDTRGMNLEPYTPERHRVETIIEEKFEDWQWEDEEAKNTFEPELNNFLESGERYTKLAEMLPIARQWVLGGGNDCSGRPVWSLRAFVDCNKAKEWHDSLWEGSEGNWYKITESWFDVMEHCFSHPYQNKIDPNQYAFAPDEQ